MKKNYYNNNGYGSNGMPINFIDKDGMLWIYQGKGKDGSDNWIGCYEFS